MAVAVYVAGLGSPPLGRDLEVSRVVLDRYGRVLRPFATSEGRWRLPVTDEEIDPGFIRALLTYEDKRFYAHPGVDLLALSRAGFKLFWRGHVVSGGSTLTMQVARLLEPRTERNLGAKLRQMVRAIELERRLSKSEILALYLNLAPYGGNLEGVRAAALAYFGKEPRRLTLAETALLVALPQAPELRRPDRSVVAAQTARDRVLDRLATAGLIEVDEAEQARATPVPSERQPMPALSPHAAEQAVLFSRGRQLQSLTLDAGLQQRLERLVLERARALGPDISVALLVIDNGSGDVLAHIGSADYFDERRAGQIDMTTALRSPGSTLKPFIYGIAFEDGLLNPETLIDDRPVRYGAYAPENFDLSFQGTVTVRRALQLSLNVPAVSVLEAIGPNRFAARLGEAGAQLVLPKGDAPGLAMGLGGVGIRLTDLTMLYAGIARLGTSVPLTEQLGGVHSRQERRLLDPVAAWYVGNVLLGTPAPENALKGRIAYKTGTSYGYRDAWAIGFDGQATIGVWVGRPDNAPVAGLVGRSVAAPILFDAFARIDRPRSPLPAAPKGALISATAKLPSPLQRFRPAEFVAQGGDPPPRIIFPPNGASLERTGGSDPLAISLSGGILPITVLVNGIPAGSTRGHRTLFWEPDGPGFVRLTVMDARGAADSVLVRVQ